MISMRCVWLKSTRMRCVFVITLQLQPVCAMIREDIGVLLIGSSTSLCVQSAAGETATLLQSHMRNHTAGAARGGICVCFVTYGRLDLSVKCNVIANRQREAG